MGRAMIYGGLAMIRFGLDVPTPYRATDRTLRNSTITAFTVVIALSAASSFGADWTQWGGPNGDFTVSAKELLDTWPAGGPRRLWKRPLGEGYASILYKEGKLYTSYSTPKEEVVISLDAATGKTV